LLPAFAEDRAPQREAEIARGSFFAAERNVSSAAMALGVNRNTVASRLRAIEERLGRSLGACAPDLEAALRLEEVGQQPFGPPSRAVR